MTAVFEPVRAARLAWMRQQDQLFFEVDDLTKFEEPCRVAATPVVSPATANTRGSSEHIGVGTELLAVPGNSPTEKGMDTTCSSAIAREGRPTPNTNTNGSIRKPSWASADGAARRVTP